MKKTKLETKVCSGEKLWNIGPWSWFCMILKWTMIGLADHRFGLLCFIVFHWVIVFYLRLFLNLEWLLEYFEKEKFSQPCKKWTFAENNLIKWESRESHIGNTVESESCAARSILPVNQFSCAYSFCAYSFVKTLWLFLTRQSQLPDRNLSFSFRACLGRVWYKIRCL